MNKKKITKEQADFIKSNATIVTLPSGEKYYYIPSWFTIHEQDEEYITINRYSFEKLPQELIDYVNKSRNEVFDKSEINLKRQPKRANKELYIGDLGYYRDFKYLCQIKGEPDNPRLWPVNKDQDLGNGPGMDCDVSPCELYEHLSLEFEFTSKQHPRCLIPNNSSNNFSNEDESIRPY